MFQESMEEESDNPRSLPCGNNLIVLRDAIYSNTAIIKKENPDSLL